MGWAVAAIGAAALASPIVTGALAPERPVVLDSSAAQAGQSSDTQSSSAHSPAPPGANEPASRGMRNGLFVSSRDPQMEMRVAPELKYIGKTDFDLRGVSHVERHHFAAVENGEITRMLVLQFNETLPDHNDTYPWKVKNPQTLGNQVYDFSTFVFSVAKVEQDHPEAEVAHTQALLAARHLRLQDQLAVVRLARVLGEDRRHAFSIFYIEPLATISARLQNAASSEDEVSSAYENLSAALTERALSSFAIAELPSEAH